MQSDTLTRLYDWSTLFVVNGDVFAYMWHGYHMRTVRLFFTGCIFGCICRLFAGRKFSRLVTDTIRLKSRWSAAHASYLKEELARYGYCLNDSVNSEIDDDRKPRKFVNPVKLRGKCDKASNISSAGSFRSRKFARMGCLIPEVSGKRTTMPAYSGVVETNDDATSSAAGRSLSNMDVIAEAGSSLTSENANEVI
jgi:hypothetical protein